MLAATAGAALAMAKGKTERKKGCCEADVQQSEQGGEEARPASKVRAASSGAVSDEHKCRIKF